MGKKYVVYTVFDGPFKNLKEIFDEGLLDWIACCDPDDKECPSSFELWLGPNMLKPHNLNPLKKYIKSNKLDNKFNWLDARKKVFGLSNLIKETHPDLAQGLRKAYEIAELYVIGPCCYFRPYANFIKYVALCYYLYNRHASCFSECELKPIFIDVREPCFFGIQKSKFQDKIIGQKKLRELFLRGEQQDVQIKYCDGGFLGNFFLYNKR